MRCPSCGHQFTLVDTVSEKEMELLVRLVWYSSAKEAGAALGLGPKATWEALDRCRKRLMARSLTHLVALLWFENAEFRFLAGDFRMWRLRFVWE